MMNKILNNFVIKVLIQIALPLVIALVDNITGDWIVNGKIVNIVNSNKKYVIIMSIVYIIIIIWYAYNEHKKDKEEVNYDNNIRAKDKIINTYCKEISLITAIFDQTQDNINKLTKTFSRNKEFDLREWNFESIATPICKGIYETILLSAENGDSFSVNIYKKYRIKKADGKIVERVKMIAHEGDHKYEPKILGVPKLYKPNSEYQYMKQFVNSNPKRTILLGREEIRKAFKFNGDYENYKDEYSQYIGIPVICKGNTMISLIEIIAHEDSKIAIDKEHIEKIINNYVLPYQYFLLMSHKIEKNMKTTIKFINKEDIVIGEEQQA